jgi:hypothetical protein
MTVPATVGLVNKATRADLRKRGGRPDRETGDGAQNDDVLH